MPRHLICSKSDISKLRSIYAIQQWKIVQLTAVAKMQEREEVDYPTDQSFQVQEFLLKNHSDPTEDEYRIYHTK